MENINCFSLYCTKEVYKFKCMSTAFHCIAPSKFTSSNVEKDPSEVSCNIDGLYNLTDFSHPK